jgi:hypothetical protein
MEAIKITVSEDHMDNLAQLVGCLRAARDNPDDLYHIIGMLTAISEYLDTLEDVHSENLTVPLTKFASDIHDLRSGHTPPHLKVRGYRGTTASREVMQGQVVGAIEFLAQLEPDLEAGKNLENIYEEVARICNAAGISNGASEKPITGKLIGSWRRKLNEDPDRYPFMKSSRDTFTYINFPEEFSDDKKRKYVLHGLKGLLEKS